MTLEEAQARISALESAQSSNPTAIISTNNEEISKLQERVADLELLYNNADEREYERMQYISELRFEIVQLKRDAESATNTIADKDEKIARLEAKIDELRDEIHRLKFDVMCKEWRLEEATKK